MLGLPRNNIDKCPFHASTHLGTPFYTGQLILNNMPLCWTRWVQMYGNFRRKWATNREAVFTSPSNQPLLSSHSPLLPVLWLSMFFSTLSCGPCSCVLVTLVYHSVIIFIRALFPFTRHLPILFSIWITLRSVCSHFPVALSFIVLLNTSALWVKPPSSFFYYRYIVKSRLRKERSFTLIRGRHSVREVLQTNWGWPAPAISVRFALKLH